MNQGFKKLYYSTLVHLPSQLMLGGYLVFVVLAFAFLEERWLFLSLLWVFLFTILGRLANNGHPAWLATVLTPNFYAVRTLNGRWSIFQRRRGKGGPADRRAALKELVEEQVLLPASLKPGRYQAITHGTVICRLQEMPNVSEVAVVLVYFDTPKMPLGKGYRSGRNSAGKKKRPFYLVKFTVTK